MRFRTSKLFVSVIPVLGLGAGIGLLAAIMGVGGGFIMVPALIYLLKVPTNVVVGTSLFQIIFVAAYTTIVHSTANQTVDVVLAFVLMVGGVAGAQYGAKAGQKLRGEQLRALACRAGARRRAAPCLRSFRTAREPLFARPPSVGSDAVATFARPPLLVAAPGRDPRRSAQDDARPGSDRDRALHRSCRASPSDFTGADLTIFGALDNADPLVSRQGRYDIIVVLEGPARPVVVRRKYAHSRRLDQHRSRKPSSTCRFPIRSPRRDRCATSPIPTNYRQLSLGRRQHLYGARGQGAGTVTIDEFTAALRDRKMATGLYNERVGGVQFLSQNLFRATLQLAPNVPVGTHRARAFLFRNGIFIQRNLGPARHREGGLRAVDLPGVARLRLPLRRLRRVACHAHRLARPHGVPAEIETAASARAQHRAGDRDRCAGCPADRPRTHPG